MRLLEVCRNYKVQKRAAGTTAATTTLPASYTVAVLTQLIPLMRPQHVHARSGVGCYACSSCRTTRIEVSFPSTCTGPRPMAEKVGFLSPCMHCMHSHYSVHNRVSLETDVRLLVRLQNCLLFSHPVIKDSFLFFFGTRLEGGGIARRRSSIPTHPPHPNRADITQACIDLLSRTRESRRDCMQCAVQHTQTLNNLICRVHTERERRKEGERSREEEGRGLSFFLLLFPQLT